MSQLFSLNARDFIRGAVVAVLTAVVVTLGSAFTQAGFDFFNAEWQPIINDALKSGVGAFVGYLTKNFLSDDRGRVMGEIG